MEKKSSKNGGDVDNQEVEILLFTYRCVYDKILSCHRLSYQIGFWTLTAIILTVGYAASSKQYLLLSTIPFIFVVGASIYYNVMMHFIYHSKYNFEIERKIKDLTNFELLDIEHQCGILGERVFRHLSHEIALVTLLFIAFLASIGIGGYYAFCLLEWYKWLVLFVIYFLMPITFTCFVWDGIRYYLEQRKKLWGRSRNSKSQQKEAQIGFYNQK